MSKLIEVQSTVNETADTIAQHQDMSGHLRKMACWRSAFHL